MKTKTKCRPFSRVVCVLLTVLTVFSAVALSVSAYNNSGVYYHIKSQSSGGIYYFGYDYENGKMITRSDGEENALYFTYVGGFYVEYAGQMWYGSCANAGWGAPNSSTISDGLMTLGTTHIDNKNDSAKYGAHFTGAHSNENRTIDTDFIFRCWYYARKKYPNGAGVYKWEQGYMQEAVSIAYRCEWDTRMLIKRATPTTSISSISEWNALPKNEKFESSVSQANWGVIEAGNSILCAALIDEDGLKGNIKRPDSYTMTFTKNGTTSIMHLLNMNNPDNERRNRQNMFIFRQDTTPNVTEYDISAKKVDADTGEVLAGATFKIEKKSGSSWTDLNMPLTTESDGIVTWSNFPPGTYRITETAAPSGYQIDPTPQEVTVGSSSSSSVTVTFRDKPDKPETYKVAVQKEDERYTEQRRYLTGAWFALYKKNSAGTYVQYGEEQETKQREGIGLCAYWSDLPEGDYYVKETRAPSGYALNDTKVYFSLPYEKSGGERGSTYRINQWDGSNADLFMSNVKYGNLQIKKVDIKGDPISGVTFGVYTSSSKTGYVKSATTGTDGVATFTDLLPGTYYLFETSAPSDYKINPNKYYTGIVESDTTKWANAGYGVPNPPKDFTLQIVKHIDGSIFTYVPGAKFQLYQKQSYGYVKYGSEKTTDDMGTVKWTELPVGDYYYVETYVPRGYKLDTTPHYLHFSEDSTSDSNGKGYLTVDIYEPIEAYWTPQVEKKLTRSFDTAGEPESNFGEFSFVLKEWNGRDWVDIDHKSIVGSGTVTFNELKFYEADAGTHKYRVYEETGSNNRVSYDDHYVEFTVTVTYIDSSHWSEGDRMTISTSVSSNQHPASASDKEKTTFTNYVPDGTWTPTAQKVLIGRKLTDKEFTFTLEEKVNGKWNTLQTKQNTADRTVPFEEIYYTLANVGTHTYRISENKGSDSTVIYDVHTVEFNVSVTYDRKNGTALTITESVSSSDPDMDKSEITTFTNYVPVKIEIEKDDPNGHTLAGAEFCLQWSEDGKSWANVKYTAEIEKGGCENADVVDGKLTTDDDGKIAYERLYPGLHYRLTETKAPSGMQLLTETAYEGVLPPDMDVTDPETLVSLRVVNQPVFTLPATGGHGFWNAALAVPLLCVSIAIIGLALGGGSFKKKKQK